MKFKSRRLPMVTSIFSYFFSMAEQIAISADLLVKLEFKHIGTKKQVCIFLNDFKN